MMLHNIYDYLIIIINIPYLIQAKPYSHKTEISLNLLIDENLNRETS